MTSANTTTARLEGPLLQTAVSYAAATGVLAVYGIRVCPFLDSLPWWNVTAVLGGGFLLAAPLRLWLIKRTLAGLEGRAATQADLSLPRKTLLRDLALWCLVGALLMVFDTVVYGFPLGSGIKVIIGCVALGLFGATDLALQIERGLMERLARAPIAPVPTSAGGAQEEPLVPLSRKFMGFFSIVLPLVALMLVLILQKDFDYLAQAPQEEVGPRFKLVALEVLFVLSVLLVGCFLVARRFASNMNALFAYQIRAMEAVTRGDFDVNVPVVSRDELNLIANHTNRMIIGLREKERVKRAFGKYMSPQVADRILASEHGAKLGGRSVRAAVLFTDLRGFTPLSERLAPEQLVEVLNEYFTSIVSCVHERGGVLDKFIGDAAMAVFGLDDDEGACERAVLAAFAMRQQLGAFNATLLARGLPTVENGVGICFGPVLAGNIGSPERLEYTVIGDTVNVASRIESATKELGVHVVISASAHAQLSEKLRGRFTALGAQTLKGKSSATDLFGWREGEPTPAG